MRSSMFGGKSLEFTGKKIKVTIRKTKKNQDALATFMKKANTKDKELLKLSFETKEGIEVKLGDLNSDEFKSAPNRGDVAEGIFAAAIFARFESKAKDIKVADVKDVLKRCKRTLKVKDRIGSVSLKEKSSNENGILDDTITLSITLAATNIQSLVDETFWSEFKDIFSASVKYVNRNVVKEWADLLYFNNQKNLIEIVSDGTEDQKTTKVDVHVKIDKKLVDINVSLKVNDVRQFGQIGGVDWKKLVPAWKKLGIDITPLKKRFYDRLAAKDAVGALGLIYDHVTKLKNINTDKVKDFVIYNATLNADDVTLVNLSKQVVVYNFKKLRDLKIKTITVEKKKDKEGKPTLVFYADGMELIQLRMKIDNKPSTEYGVYVRTLVEKLNGLTALIGEKI